jgi:putative heme iron utilization protein
MTGGEWKHARKVSCGGTPAGGVAGSMGRGYSGHPRFELPKFMDSAQKELLRQIVETQEIAALGTLHEKHSFVSMVPFAMLGAGAGFVIHVSQLASHTKDMLADPDVSLLVTAVRHAGAPAQATARITVQGRAIQCARGTPDEEAARAAYFDRFPESEPMFGFGDFSLFVIEPVSIRFVGGFAQARTLSPKAFAEALES